MTKLRLNMFYVLDKKNSDRFYTPILRTFHVVAVVVVVVAQLIKVTFHT